MIKVEATELLYGLFSECYICHTPLNKAPRPAQMKREGGVPFWCKKQPMHTKREGTDGALSGDWWPWGKKLTKTLDEHFYQTCCVWAAQGWSLPLSRSGYFGQAGWARFLVALCSCACCPSERESKSRPCGESKLCPSLPISLPSILPSFLLSSFSFWFLEQCLRHLEVPRLGVESELQLPAYTTATAMQEPSCICDLPHSSWQHQILTHWVMPDIKPKTS